jgi:hypothetical protein
MYNITSSCKIEWRLGGKQLGRDAAARGTTKGSGAGSRPPQTPGKAQNGSALRQQLRSITCVAAIAHAQQHIQYGTSMGVVHRQEPGSAYPPRPRASSDLPLLPRAVTQQISLGPVPSSGTPKLQTCLHCTPRIATARTLMPPLPPSQHTASVAARCVRPEPGYFGWPYMAGVRSKVESCRVQGQAEGEGGTARNEIRAKPGTGSLRKVFVVGR